MRILWRELRELARGPEFAALVVICLLLGVGDSWCLSLAWDQWEWADPLWRIVTVPPPEELPEELRRALPWLR